MKTPKESFGGTDSPVDKMNEWRSTGLERMIQREIADQVAGVLRNM
jgi:hypothetical protein